MGWGENSEGGTFGVGGDFLGEQGDFFEFPEEEKKDLFLIYLGFLHVFSH